MINDSIVNEEGVQTLEHVKHELIQLCNGLDELTESLNDLIDFINDNELYKIGDLGNVEEVRKDFNEASKSLDLNLRETWSYLIQIQRKMKKQKEEN